MEGSPGHTWYDRRAWKRRRRHQLATHPLCAMCLANNKVVAAEIADHIEPHKGDETKFWFGALQSLCKACHDSTKKAFEARGYEPGIGEDGWPVDQRHPVYKEG